MGNRAVVQFIDAINPQGFSVYQHWGADDVRATLEAAAPSMRKGDAGYAAARWIGYLCQHVFPLDSDGRGYSVGLVDSPFDPENGLYVVNCDTGRVTCYREGWTRKGGFTGELARSGRPFTIKLGSF